MSSEIIATFEVDRVTERDGALAVADLIVTHLDAADFRCGGPHTVGSGLRLVASAGRRRVPLFVGPVPADNGGPRRWFVSIGASMTPLARAIGGKDEDVRARVTAVITSALASAPGIRAVRWHDDDPAHPPPE